MILFVVVFILAGVTTWGVLTSRKQRGSDPRNFAAFVGFIAAAIAVTAMLYHLIETGMRGHASPNTMTPLLRVLDAVVSIIFFGALLVTLVAGLFSRGMRRVTLLCCGFAVSLMLLLTIAAHFGD